jgi:hypothetical protein
VKGSQPLAAKTDVASARLPLREIPLNGFLDKLRKREVVTSVEIMVCYILGEKLIVEYCCYDPAAGRGKGGSKTTRAGFKERGVG